jgi:lysophospholipase L1-like esterase
LAQAPGVACGQDRNSLRYLALGDSYTIGEGVKESENFPYQLVNRLNERGIGISNPPIIAQTGWTTADLDKAITAANLDGPFDLVTLLIGVNNQYQGRSLEEYSQQFESLLKRAIALAGDMPARVVVISIPDYSVTPFAAQADTQAIAASIDAFNAANLEISSQLGARYADITTLSRDIAAETDAFAPDGLHPSGSQYSRWVSLIEPIACAALSSEPGG